MSEWIYCSSDEWPQDEISHCGGCHDEWDDYDNGVISCDHRMDTDMKDGRYLVYCCAAIAWFEQQGLVK